MPPFPRKRSRSPQPEASGTFAGPTSPSRRAFLQSAGLLAAGAVAGGAGGAAIGAAVGAGHPGLDFAADKATPKTAFDHVVVVMFENRSFDNLLGWLYRDDEIPAGSSFDGLHQGDYSNPAPHGHPDVKAHVYTGSTDVIMSSPQPDPGEAYPHVNTQFFGTVDAELHNTPPVGAKPTMKGFVTDYIANYERLSGGRKSPTRAEYSMAMGGFSPDMLPVFSTLAKNFAVYDHWHCAVPSQTFCNRSFFHAATSHGYVTNQGDGGYDKWLDPDRADSPTVFNRLEEAGIPWRVYYDAAQLVSMTGVLHAPATEKYWKTNFRTLDQFYLDVESGNLPAYSFIEPRMVFNHNDMHPPYGVLREGSDGFGGEVEDGAVSDVRAGDALLHYLYTAIKDSKSPTGSNAMNTMLFVTFDEHGGTFDHATPPSAVPPGDGRDGEMGFAFDRLGGRVPAIAISAYTAKNTIINDPMQHSALVATLSRQHGLEPLTERDATSMDMFNAINRMTPRPVSDWPTTLPHYVPPNPDENLDPNAPQHRAKKLSSPAKGLLGLLMAKYASPDEPVPESYHEAFAALVMHGKGLFGTLDSSANEGDEDDAG